jgi:recombination protein RecR
MSVIPKALSRLIEELTRLPGVGSRTAERYALGIVRSDSKQAHRLADAISSVHEGINYCTKTFVLCEPGEELSPLYTDPSRDKAIVAVVEDAFDVVALESIGTFKGTYHVLGGLLSPLDNIGPDQLTIAQLIKRVEEDNVIELILATNASVEGESTSLYIQKLLGDSDVKISRLARGLPMGVDLEYADRGTLTKALEGRTEF